MTTDLVKVDKETGEILDGGNPSAIATLFGTSDPVAIALDAAARANVLKEVVVEKGLVSKIAGRDHITIDGWTFLGSMFGIFGVLEWSRPLVDADGNRFGWEARVEAKTLDGRIVGAAEAMCTKHENRWAKADEYAVRSMAQTRATSKALRMPLSFVVVLAGYEGSPAEEQLETSPDPNAAQPDQTRARDANGSDVRDVRPVETTAATGDGTVESGPSHRNDGAAASEPPEDSEGERSSGVREDLSGTDGASNPSAPDDAPATAQQWASLLSICGDSATKATSRINKANKTSYSKAEAQMAATVGELAKALAE